MTEWEWPTQHYWMEVSPGSVQMRASKYDPTKPAPKPSRVGGVDEPSGDGQTRGRIRGSQRILENGCALTRRSGALWLPRMSERNRRRWVAAVIALVGLIAAEFAMPFVAKAVGRGVIILHAIPVLILLAYFIASWD